MSYLDSKSEFETDFAKHPADKSGGSVSTAWTIYQKASLTPLMMNVLGRHVQSEGGGIMWFSDVGLKNDPSSPTGVSGASDHIAQNFGLNAETTGAGDKFNGSILAAGGWDMTVNDSWVLGGVHGAMKFYCASPMTKANLIHPKYHVTITGREVLGLLVFGYKFVRTERLGSLFQVNDREKAYNATFAQYASAVANANSTADGLFKAEGLYQ